MELCYFIESHWYLKYLFIELFNRHFVSIDPLAWNFDFLIVLTATRHDFLWKHFIALIFFSNLETAFAFAFVVNYHFLLCSHSKDQQLCMRFKVVSFYKIRVAFWLAAERVSLVIQFHLFRFWVLLRYSNWKTKQTIWQ